MGGHSNNSAPVLINTQGAGGRGRGGATGAKERKTQEKRNKSLTVPVMLSVEYSPASMESGSPQLGTESLG